MHRPRIYRTRRSDLIIFLLIVVTSRGRRSLGNRRERDHERRGENRQERRARASARRSVNECRGRWCILNGVRPDSWPYTPPYSSVL